MKDPDALKRLYALIYNRIGENDSCWPSFESMAADLGWGVTTVKKRCKILEQLVLIKHYWRGMHKTNTYVPLWHPWFEVRHSSEQQSPLTRNGVEVRLDRPQGSSTDSYTRPSNPPGAEPFEGREDRVFENLKDRPVEPSSQISGDLTNKCRHPSTDPPADLTDIDPVSANSSRELSQKNRSSPSEQKNTAHAEEPELTAEELAFLQASMHNYTRQMRNGRFRPAHPPDYDICLSVWLASGRDPVWLSELFRAKFLSNVGPDESYGWFLALVVRERARMLQNPPDYESAEPSVARSRAIVQ